MPELPEVETVRRTLEHLVLGKTIKGVTVTWPKIIKHPDDVKMFNDLVAGQTIHSVGRRGKFLKILLDDVVLVSHLRMEGRYVYVEGGEEPDKHTHVIFHFTDGTELWYRDVRKFGTMHVYSIGEEESNRPLSLLGPEPFDETFNPEHLWEKLQKTSRKVKPTLLDQAVLVGLGNIYVDEALFRVSIHPETIANKLSKKQVKALHKAIVDTLQEAVDQGGSTIRSYVNSQGDMGMFQQRLAVYARKGEPCLHCGTEIERIVVGGRGTHICPNCQK
ncbi:DNA-formamidopyrimidine glycosylase [Pseudalkalibacillus berkeleyi]|uniref:Formamidopyrimidine-DNA glycosylase n=1 Tax=Pseudalkalibacillus berkeleyi TaxID=1069813 RepID=A0ABS9GZM0_9BACL|nr:DNA-formamidopyrimidine glycosylase [Pseudalkalibacillus berkeleyi]MCF6138192.1 DNA-formamidopyrimidine glycosylase [Pseudalkalibacillus berkeleyi]